MIVTLQYPSRDLIDATELRYQLQEYPNLLDAQRAVEGNAHETRVRINGQPIVQAWLGKHVNEVRELFQRAAENEKLEFLPDELWTVSKFGVLRRFSSKFRPW